MFKGTLVRLHPVTPLIVVLAIALSSAPTVLAATANRQTAPSGLPAPIKGAPATVAAGDISTPYYSVETITLSDDTQPDRTIINGPPTPPPGY